MQNTNSETRNRLILDPEGFAEKERLVSYEIGNALLMLNLELQRNFRLRAEEYQIFMLIVLSTVQRFARNPGSEVTLLGRTTMPPEVSGSISRRRISETLDIPLETVRRTVASLLARDLIVERSRGCLSTPGGTLSHLSENALPERIARRFLSVSNTMARLGAAKLAVSG
ncbi:MAG TPA: hypothetical protein VJ906_03650 [Roseovarius sp.]|nr:hypothetical protein [Roseovarius sp.]